MKQLPANVKNFKNFQAVGRLPGTVPQSGEHSWNDKR